MSREPVAEIIGWVPVGYVPPDQVPPDVAGPDIDDLLAWMLARGLELEEATFGFGRYRVEFRPDMVSGEPWAGATLRAALESAVRAVAAGDPRLEGR